MTFPTPTPDPGPYPIALLVVFSLGAVSLAAQLRARWPGRRRPAFLPLYAAVMAPVAAAGVVAFGPTLVTASPTLLAVALPAGLATGWLAARIDRRVVRALTRVGFGAGRRGADATSGGGWVHRARGIGLPPERRIVRVTPVPTPGGPPRRPTRQPPLRSHLPRNESELQTSLSGFVAVAVLEELLHRGVVLHAALLLPGVLPTALALAGAVALFALAHTGLGWPHVVAKLPLGIAATVVVLVLGTVWAAVAAHVAFNVLIWRARTRRTGGSEGASA